MIRFWDFIAHRCPAAAERGDEGGPFGGQRPCGHAGYPGESGGTTHHRFRSARFSAKSNFTTPSNRIN